MSSISPERAVVEASLDWKISRLQMSFLTALLKPIRYFPRRSRASNQPPLKLQGLLLTNRVTVHCPAA